MVAGPGQHQRHGGGIQQRLQIRLAVAQCLGAFGDHPLQLLGVRPALLQVAAARLGFQGGGHEVGERAGHQLFPELPVALGPDVLVADDRQRLAAHEHRGVQHRGDPQRRQVAGAELVRARILDRVVGGDDPRAGHGPEVARRLAALDHLPALVPPARAVVEIDALDGRAVGPHAPDAGPFHIQCVGGRLGQAADRLVHVVRGDRGGLGQAGQPLALRIDVAEQHLLDAGHQLAGRLLPGGAHDRPHSAASSSAVGAGRST